MEANSTEPIKKCSRCGTVLNDKPKFCPNCGSKILWENKKTEHSMAHNVLKVFFSILPFPVIVIFLGILYVLSDGGIEALKPEKGITELDIKKDSIATEIAKETGLSFQEVKSFGKEMNGLTVISIETGHLPVNIFQSAPSCNIKLMNMKSNSITWSRELFAINWRVVIDDVYTCPSHYLDRRPEIGDPISPGQVIDISCENGYGDSWIRNVQLKKSKIVIEILKEGEPILKLPIKNKDIDMTQFL